MMPAVHGIHSRDDEDWQYLLDGGVDGEACSGPGGGGGSGPGGGGGRGRGRRKATSIPVLSAAGARNRYAVHRSTTLLPGAVAPVLSCDHCEGVATVKFHLDRGVLGDAVSWAT